MDLLEQLEYSLPILKVSTDTIVIETSNKNEQCVIVENIGGGTLSGKVMSNSSHLKFKDEVFNGNTVKLDFVADIQNAKPGETIRTSFVILSNGGEKIVQVAIKIIPFVVKTSDDVPLTTLKDFLNYSKKYPMQARQLFISNEFMIWLQHLGYEYMDFYDRLIVDPNRERALENFFLLNKLKNKTQISIATNTTIIHIDPVQTDIVSGVVDIKKSGWGYVEADVDSKKHSNWLKLSTKRVSSSDFDETDTARIYYYIDTSLIRQKIVKDTVCIGNQIEFGITVKKKPFIDAKLSKECFDFEDSGFLIVNNYTRKDVMVDVTAKDSFVKFEGKRYYISGYAEIPFQIKFTGLGLAQLSIKKQPFVETDITIRANTNDTLIKKTILFSIGDYIK